MRMNEPTRIITIVYLLIVAFSMTGLDVAASENTRPAHPTLDSYLSAKIVYEKALAAHGGADKIASIRNVELSMEGNTVMRHQSIDHSAVNRTPRSDHLVLDFTTARAYQDTNRFFGADLHEGDRVYVMNGDDIFTYIDETNTAQDNDPANRFPDTTFIEWSLPRLILKEISNNARNIRSLGSESLDGKSYEVLSYPWPNSQVVSLYFDSTTGLLNRLSRPTMDALEGDTAIDYIYTDYEVASSGVAEPTTLRVELAGEVVLEQEYQNIIYDRDLDDSMFDRPRGVRFIHMEPPAGYKLVEVLKDVYVVDFPQTRPNVFFVIFEDYIVAMEAPANSLYSSQAIAAIRTVSDKPIRYVIPTHHHNDHSGGLRAFVAEGATIISPSDDLKYYRKMLAARYTVFPDALSDKNIAATFEIVEDERVFTDNTHSARLVNIGGPHASNMFILWLPEDHIVITADTFEYFDGHPVAAASNAAVSFAKVLDDENIRPRLILESHSRAFYTWEDLQTSLELRAKEEKEK
jgi:glyoxylase-like metal-dependent hydrolase (beta-lactamase superfamily II)